MPHRQSLEKGPPFAEGISPAGLALTRSLRCSSAAAEEICEQSRLRDSSVYLRKSLTG
jgi:hypothetical protein